MGSFDMIFMDPPFDQPKLMSQTISWLEESELMNQGALLYVESNQKVLPSEMWMIEKEKQVGEVYMHLWRRIDDKKMD